jgi:2-octaprenyl-6-methoxyphenol hydroxylase
MAKSKREHDIIIAGGGMPGLSLALLLGRAGCNVAVLEAGDLAARAAQSDTSGRTAALIPENIDLLRRVGAWPAIRDHAAPMQALCIVDDCQPHACRPLIRNFPASEIGRDNLGHNVPLHAGLIALYEQVRQCKAITLYETTRLYDYSRDDAGVTVRTEGGTTLRAYLLVGADGQHSLVRTIANIATQCHDYGQSALTAVVTHEHDHHNTSIEFHRPGGPFTLVPMPGRMSALVWVADRDEAAAMAASDRAVQNAAIQARGRDMLGAVELRTQLMQWPLSFMRANALSAPRIALIGEAAHVLPPTGAQGLNLSLRDAAGMVDTILETMRLGMDPGNAQSLRAYDTARRQDIALRASASDGLNRLVRSHHPAIQVLRRGGLSLSGYATPLKTFLMQQGLAPEDTNATKDSA